MQAVSDTARVRTKENTPFSEELIQVVGCEVFDEEIPGDDIVPELVRVGGVQVPQALYLQGTSSSVQSDRRAMAAPPRPPQGPPPSHALCPDRQTRKQTDRAALALALALLHDSEDGTPLPPLCG